MTKTYLVVYEKGNECWGAFAPDVLGTGGMGDTLEETRISLTEGIRQMLEYYVENNLPLPEPKATSVDFSDFDPDPTSSHYEIEWLTVNVPEPVAPQHFEQQAA